MMRRREVNFLVSLQRLILIEILAAIFKFYSLTGDDEDCEAAIPGRLLPEDGGDVRQEVLRGAAGVDAAARGAGAALPALAARPAGTNCIKIVLPGKLILSERKGLRGSPILLKIVSENRFSGKTYFYTIASSRPR